LVVALFVLLAISNSCKHEIAMPSEKPVEIPVVSENCSPDSVYFANEIFPLISSSCAMAGCHDAISHEDGVNLTTYSNIMKYVVVGNASRSKLYKVLTESGEDRMPPPPRAPFTNLQMQRLRTWIEQGAKNNVCNSCDTTDFKYSTAIKPLIQNNCQGCHTGASAGGSIDLSTYNGVKAVALNGKLYGSITWAPGFSAMPKGIKLTDCRIKQVKKWIDAGSPNN
jgi:hypothetical protein